MLKECVTAGGTWRQMLSRSLEFVNGCLNIPCLAILAFFQQAFLRQQWGQQLQLPGWPGSAMWLRNLFWKFSSEPFLATFPVILRVSVINDLLLFFKSSPVGSPVYYYTAHGTQLRIPSGVCHLFGETYPSITLVNVTAKSSWCKCVWTLTLKWLGQGSLEHGCLTPSYANSATQYLMVTQGPKPIFSLGESEWDTEAMRKQSSELRWSHV